MKKNSVLLTGFLLFAIVLHAQKKDHRLVAEISLGPSLPIGKFGNKSFGSEYHEPSGFAKTGFNAQVSLGYYLNESFGILLLPSYSVHVQDRSGLQAFMKEVYLSMGLRTSRVDVDPQSWKIVKLMAGGFFVTPLTAAEDLVLQTKLTAGACKTAIPALSYTGYDADNEMPYPGKMGKTSLSWAFCYQVSVGLKYNLNNKLHLLLDVNSFNATPKKDYFFTSADPRTPDPGQQTVKYKLAEVNALVGVGLSF
jgi:hypothetical protein